MLLARCRVIAVKELIRVVAPVPELRETLLAGLLNECLMGQSNGDVLLHHCFMFLPQEDCKVCALTIGNTTRLWKPIGRAELFSLSILDYHPARRRFH